jgi:hypothetical protein
MQSPQLAISISMGGASALLIVVCTTLQETARAAEHNWISLSTM